MTRPPVHRLRFSALEQSSSWSRPVAGPRVMTARAAFRFATLVLLSDHAETTVTLPIQCEAPSNTPLHLTAGRSVARR